MLSLIDPLWSDLDQAYGKAGEIPALLVQLNEIPNGSGRSEPWFSIWSSLAHQGDVYGASFAAVPYVVDAIQCAPLRVDINYFQFPAWVEICRVKNGITVPENLADAYFAALSRIPALVAAASGRNWDSDFAQCALSAIAASKGQIALAEVNLELTPEIAQEFLEWHFDR